MIDKFDFFLNHSSNNLNPIKPYKIYFYHLVLMLEGKCTYILDGKHYELKKNDALLIVPGTMRQRLGEHDYLHIVILNFYAYEKDRPIKNQVFKNAVNQTIRKLLEVYPYKAYKDLNQKRTQTFESPKIYNALHYVFECILLELYDSLKYPTNNQHIINSINYINDNITLPLTLNDVSRTAHLSKEYTSRLFKKEMGMTVSEYINKQKLSMAKDMLANANISLREISATLGYENYTYFTKLFKETYQISPQMMRRELKIHTRRG